MSARCTYRAGSAQCCKPPEHDGAHHFKCAGKYCTGLPWVASRVPHPTFCAVEKLSRLPRDQVSA